MTLQQIASAAANVDTLQSNLHRAEEYVARIGTAQPHFKDGSVGTLHSVKVATEIHHQAYSNATNYWKSAEFDGALAEVIREHFPELAREALARMAQAYHSALIDQKENLKAALAEVDVAEQSAAGVIPIINVNQSVDCSKGTDRA